MHKRLKLLRLIADGELYSGEGLGETLGISRTAVWKIINSLAHYGLSIQAVKGRGYRLSRPIEFLNKKLILTRINSSAVKILNSLEIFEEIDSTNQYLLQRLENPGHRASVVLAEYQTQGRGRRGRSWVSPFASGVSLSVSWHFEQPVESINCLSLAFGSAVIRALSRTGFKGIGLKWPNDIFYQGKKLGGVLIEMRGETAGPCDVVIGLGLNIAFPPDFGRYIEQPWVDLVSIKDSIPSRNEITAELISEFISLLDGYASKPIEDIIGEWRQYDCMCGKRAKLILQNKKIQGLVKGIDNDGALLMSVDGRNQRYTAGEISLRAGS